MQEPDNPRGLEAAAKGKRPEPKMVHPDSDYVDRALQMFTYYGQISWQGLAFFGAAGLVVALVPLGICQKPFWIPFVDELFAVAFMGLGAVFFDRYQNVAHRWIHVDNDTTVEDLIDNNEWEALPRTWP